MRFQRKCVWRRCYEFCSETFSKNNFSFVHTHNAVKLPQKQNKKKTKTLKKTEIEKELKLYVIPFFPNFSG